jgi:hypothetical protein
MSSIWTASFQKTKFLFSTENKMPPKRLTAEEFEKLESEELESADEKPKAVPSHYANGKEIDPKVLALMEAAEKIKAARTNINKKILSSKTSGLKTTTVEKTALQSEIKTLMRKTPLEDHQYAGLYREILGARSFDKAKQMVDDALKGIVDGKSEKEIAEKLGVPVPQVVHQAAAAQAQAEKAAETQSQAELGKELAKQIHQQEASHNRPLASPLNIGHEMNAWDVPEITPQFVQPLLNGWTRIKSRKGGMVQPIGKGDLAAFGTIHIDIPTLYHKGHFIYVMKKSGRVAEMRNTLTPGLLRLMFEVKPTDIEYDHEDALNWLSCCIGWENPPANNDPKFIEIYDDDNDVLMYAYTNAQGDHFGAGLPLPKMLQKKKKYVKKEPKIKQTIVSTDGVFGKVRIHPGELNDGVLHVRHADGSTFLKQRCSPGMRHILTSNRMGAKMREKITPDDIQTYQKIVEVAHVRPSAATQQRIISEMPVVEAPDTASLVQQLRDLIGSMEAGNSGRLLKNKARAILDKLEDDKEITTAEKEQIISVNKL